MNERIKEVRKAKKLSQEKFADNLNLSQNHLSSLENGKRAITDRIVNDICKTYNVNKSWLLTGEGEMFEDPLAPFVIKDEELKEFFKDFLAMDKSIQEDIINLVKKVKKK